MSSICPYPGLRPFNEEESIYFKGREEHIEKIILQLQEKHFLMVTGASGDGKSSLIYAGLIPRSRAGFFKAKFNNWEIVDFRPERNPLTNLAKSLSKHLKFNDTEKVEDELSYGFSSLAELYKKSDFYLDYQSEEYIHSNDEQKLALKNKCSNLLILVDQFEEMFTNTENFSNGKPSVQSITLMNLIIETTKIAAKQNLPIYIVCTMRSDYVGDCAAFKGLPELIVYSQFFVPRLKRQEIHRAILEPAKLSGNKISNRLIERLINDLSDGQDQLPILQHALNRIWRAKTDDESEEMDLIHYAMVGGINHEVLPQDIKGHFEEWFKNQPPYKKKAFAHPSLNNVLSAHARDLFNHSHEFYKKHLNQEITEDESRELIKRVFTCLTKINDNRAVRNRASVGEIKNILQDKSLNNQQIEALINPFRSNENTLIQPFIFKAENTELSDSHVLDITHESLIRNWPELSTWTREDNDNVLVLYDFKKQLNRWAESGKSSGYLLPEGSLRYFQSWYMSYKPNAFSILKYDDRIVDYKTKLTESEKFIELSKLYLSTSDKAIKRKRRAVVSLAATIILILSGFTAWALKERNKALDQQTIALSKTEEANNSKEEALSAKNLAELSKEEAIKNEKSAVTAKEQAEKSRVEAEKSRRDALANLTMARENAQLAKKETERANVSLNESEKAKTEAIKAKNIAEKAEKKSSQLSYISLAQNLAVKSGLRADNPEIQTSLALQAYNFTHDNGGETQDPVLYEALYNALKVNKRYKDNLSCNWEQTALQPFFENSLAYTADKQGNIFKWDLENEKLIDRGNLHLKTDIASVCIPSWPNRLITALSDNSVVLWDISDPKMPSKIATSRTHHGLVRKIIFHPEKPNYFISAGKDSSIVINEINSATSPNLNNFYKIKINHYVKDMALDPVSNNVVVLTENGLMYQFSLNDRVLSPINDQVSRPKATSLAYNNGLFFVGYGDGKIRVYKKNDLTSANLKPMTVISENKAIIEKFAFSSNNGLMAVSGADKVIKIFNLKKLSQKPLELKDLKTKTRSMAFNSKNQLLIATADHNIRVIETSVSKIAETVMPMLKRNLTEVEWVQNIGDDVPYEKTNKKIN